MHSAHGADLTPNSSTNAADKRDNLPLAWADSKKALLRISLYESSNLVIVGVMSQ